MRGIDLRKLSAPIGLVGLVMAGLTLGSVFSSGPAEAARLTAQQFGQQTLAMINQAEDGVAACDRQKYNAARFTFQTVVDSWRSDHPDESAQLDRLEGTFPEWPAECNMASNGPAGPVDTSVFPVLLEATGTVAFPQADGRSDILFDRFFAPDSTATLPGSVGDADFGGNFRIYVFDPTGTLPGRLFVDAGIGGNSDTVQNGIVVHAFGDSTASEIFRRRIFSFSAGAEIDVFAIGPDVNGTGIQGTFLLGELGDPTVGESRSTRGSGLGLPHWYPTVQYPGNGSTPVSAGSSSIRKRIDNAPIGADSYASGSSTPDWAIIGSLGIHGGIKGIDYRHTVTGQGPATSINTVQVTHHETSPFVAFEGTLRLVTRGPVWLVARAGIEWIDGSSFTTSAATAGANSIVNARIDDSFNPYVSIGIGISLDRLFAGR